jgi:hypothetical protein
LICLLVLPRLPSRVVYQPFDAIELFSLAVDAFKIRFTQAPNARDPRKGAESSEALSSRPSTAVATNYYSLILVSAKEKK